MDKFPEAFARFEQKTKTKDYNDYEHLRRQFIDWGKNNWKGTPKQRKALDRELEKKQLVTKIEVVTYKKHPHKAVIRRDSKGRFAKKE